MQNNCKEAYMIKTRLEMSTQKNNHRGTQSNQKGSKITTEEQNYQKEVKRCQKQRQEDHNDGKTSKNRCQQIRRQNNQKHKRTWRGAKQSQSFSGGGPFRCACPASRSLISRLLQNVCCYKMGKRQWMWKGFHVFDSSESLVSSSFLDCF